MGYEPKYTITSRLAGRLERIAELRTEIELSPISVQWTPRLERDAFERLAHTSTAIEGNPLTLKDVEILSRGGDLPMVQRRYKKEVLNYLAALRYITDHSGKKQITVKDILRLHSIVCADALERDPIGAFRDYQVVIRQHRPPKYQEVPRLVGELVDWLNSKAKDLPPVMSSAILHYRFEYIHPFGDGNGRVGRLLATWELYRRNFDTNHIFSIDEVFWEEREKYFGAIRSVQEAGGDMTEWLEYVAAAVFAALSQAWKRLEAIQSKQKGADEGLILTQKQERLLTLLRHAPLGINEIMKELSVTTRAGAHHIIKPLVQHNLVIRKGGHKTGKYVLI
ncbi:MAG: Fic family protein [Nitrospirota bacterium]|nr:Fic family protein [Nitrospirota bacterium]